MMTSNDWTWFYKSRRRTKQVFLQKDANKLPSDSNEAFSDIDFGYPKYVEGHVPGHGWTFAVAENVGLDLALCGEDGVQDLRVGIVYFANTIVNPTHGSKLIQSNIQQLLATNILYDLEKCHVDMVLAVHDDVVKTQILKIIPSNLHTRFTFYMSHTNQHEYPGIQKAYERGKTCDVVLYFHSKNMTRYDGTRTFHDPIAQKIMEDIVVNWRYVLFVLSHFPTIDKVVCTCSPEGWGWFNYWWVRGTYLQDMEPPMMTSDRYYYESWLGRNYRGPHNRIMDCWSVSASPSKGYFNVGTVYEWYESPFQHHHK